MEGYKMELLYNTLHILLKALKNKMQNVRIDDAVPLVLQVLMHEVTQPAAKVEGKRRMNRFEEDADKTSKEEKKEQKDIMGVSAQGEGLLLNCFEVLASVVTFDVSVNTIIQAIEKVMVNVYSRPILKRFETILQKIIVGFTKNTTVTEQGLITYVQKVINDKNLYHREFETIKNKKNDKFSVESNKSQIVKNHRSEEHFMVQKNPGRAGKIEDYDEKRTEQTLSISKESNDHMIVHFSVMLLEMALKHHVIRGLNDGVAVDVLGKTLIPKLVKYISGKHVSLALCSLRVLIHLSQQNTKNTLPILQEKKQTMLDGVFDLISNSGANTTGETWDTLFAALRFFLQDQSNIKMTERQLQVLLDMLKVEIYGSSQNKEFNIRSFQLLHTLITRKVMLPQIYDMMERVKTIMITANDTQIQDESIAMLTHFYLNYPFDDQVHQDNLNFMFKNIMNETLPQTGKQAMVKMVRSMIVQLPVLFLQERAEFVFCPLALQLANTALERVNTASIESLMTKNSVHEQFYTTLEDALFQFVKRIPEQVLMAKIMPLVTQQWMENKKLNFVAIRSLMVLARIANGARLKSGGHLESKGSILTFILSSIQADTKSKDSTKKKKNILMLECSLEILCELYRHGNVSHATIDSLWKSLTGLLSVTTNAETRFLSLQLLELYFSRAKSVLSETKSNLSERTNVLGVITLVTENLKQLSGKMLFMDQERNQQYIETLIKIMLEALKLVLRAEEKPDQVVEDLFGHLRKISIRADSDKQKPDLIRNNYMTFLKLFVAICAKLKALVTPYLTYMTPLLYVCTEYPKRNELRFVTQKEQQFAVDVKQVIQKQWEQMNSFETFIKAYETGKEEVLKKAQTRKQKEDLKAVKDPIAFAKQKLKDKERLSQLKKRKRVETKEAKESTPQQHQRPKKRIKK
jgi:U3 small nucleolar RNA-associated protein 20